MRPVPRAILLAVLVLLAVLPGAARARDAATWFPLPDGRPLNGGVAVDAAGHVWFGMGTTSPETNPFLGELDPATGTTTTHPTLAPGGEGCCSTQVRDVAADRATGRLYYTKSTGLVVVATAGLARQSGAFVTGKVDLGDIAAVPGGAWFAQTGASNTAGWPGNRMAFVSSDAGLTELPALSEYGGSHQSLRYDANPQGVTIAPDGSPWFTEADTGNPGYRIAQVTGGTYRERSLLCVSTAPCSGSYTGTGATSIAAAPDGTLWFTNRLTRSVGRYDPVTDAMTEYPLSGFGLPGGDPQTVRAAPDGAIWLTVRGTAPAAVRIVPQTTPGTDPTATVTALGAARGPLGLGIGADGSVWISAAGTAGADAAVGRLNGTAGTGTPPPAGTGGGDTPPASGAAGDTGAGAGATPVSLPGATTPPIVVAPSRAGTSRVQDPKVEGTGVSANQICVGPPADRCSLVYLLETHEYVTGFPGTTAAVAARKRRTRRVTVGTKTVTLAGGQSRRVTVSLNARGRKILKRDGKLNATWTVKQRVSGKLVRVKAKRLRFRR